MSSPISAPIPDTSWNLLRSVQDGSPAGWPTWEAFRRTVLEEQTTENVAGALGLSTGAVRLARLRVLRRLRRLLE